MEGKPILKAQLSVKTIDISHVCDKTREELEIEELMKKLL